MCWPYCHRLHTGPVACLLVIVTSNVPGLPGRCSSYQCSRFLLPVTKQLVCQSLQRKSNTSLLYQTCRKLWAWQKQSLVHKFSYGEMQLQYRTDNCQLTSIMFEILTILMLKVQLKCDTMSTAKKFLMFQRTIISSCSGKYQKLLMPRHIITSQTSWTFCTTMYGSKHNFQNSEHAYNHTTGQAYKKLDAIAMYKLQNRTLLKSTCFSDSHIHYSHKCRIFYATGYIHWREKLLGARTKVTCWTRLNKNCVKFLSRCKNLV